MGGWTQDQLDELYRRRAAENTDPLAEQPASIDDRPESMIQAECVKFMEEDGWRTLRTDPVSDKGRGKGFGQVGMADYLFLRYGKEDPKFCAAEWLCAAEVLWVEFKSRGGKPKKHQTEWHTKERARGALTWIASVDFPASVAGFREFYAKSGLMRRARWW